MKDRKRQRENRKIKSKEENINKRNSYGVRDLTAYNAMMKIETKGKSAIKLN